MKDLKFHEVANFWPLLQDDEFDELVADIREQGQLVPIELWEGKIIDGRNRYRACLIAGVDPECVDVDLSGRDVVAYVNSLNGARRHMTPSQLAMVADKARDYYDKRAKERQKASGGDRKSEKAKIGCGKSTTTDSLKARDEAGKALGVSGSLVDRARKVRTEGVAELGKAVEEGRMSVSAAAKLTDQDEEAQRQAAKEAKFSGGRYRNGKVSEKDSGPVVGFNKTEQFALECARVAITQLQQIPVKNPGRDKAFTKVEKWIDKQRSKS